mgnify:CR=1 FL=1
MKREMELIRQILLVVEATDDQLGVPEVAIVGRTGAEIGYHLELLDDANLVFWDGQLFVDDDHARASMLRLTWDGHEFLDNARNEGAWKQVRDTLSDNAVKSASFGIISRLLSETIARNIGL